MGSTDMTTALSRNHPAARDFMAVREALIAKEKEQRSGMSVS